MVEDLQLTEEEIIIINRRRGAKSARREAVYSLIAECPISTPAISKELAVNSTYVKAAIAELLTAGRIFPLPGKVSLGGRGRPTTVYTTTKVEKAQVNAPGVSIRREPIWVCVNRAAEQGAPCTRCNACGKLGEARIR